MSLNDKYTTEWIEDRALGSKTRRARSLRDALNKQAWFVGLYIASLFCLTATGAGVRWMLASI